MKLEKLLTLSQFVDYLTKRPIFDADSWLFIRRYNNFLKQPFTKEMFVNPYEKPNEFDFIIEDEIDPYFYEIKQKWQEAEKKVIFDGWKLRLWNDCILFDNDDLDIFIDFDDYHTIYELAEDFSGQLNLKNVEL